MRLLPPRSRTHRLAHSRKETDVAIEKPSNPASINEAIIEQFNEDDMTIPEEETSTATVPPHLPGHHGQRGLHRWSRPTLH
ncbi:hypothetical protein N8I74_14130 [Chitiniphilus purpureus]|uniref:Uncharacterized protein n=1 Tax=Chitiniphilus purpureus TaxID=2981137 RepID=A0ABY6DK84_9NEIS|nr:hypothetical protein [Chitiniphilus sp. CD1]UXY14447.1 hypothetical protein N8I74_14130 [Chitiniphilus sp. CD1]